MLQLMALQVPTTLWIVDAAITVLIYVAVYIVFNQVVHRQVLIPLLIVLFLGKLISDYFGLTQTESLIDLASIAAVVGFTSIYSQEIRRKLMNRARRRPKQAGGLDQVMLQQINDAVLFLSSNQIGAIITFERKDNLDHYIQSGETINAPINSALIKTIFYEGTALHDGAIIIRDNTICAASVYFTPSTKPLIGKYGSRHRAALGISEVTDALTVVVSEETGRITFTKRGEMIPAARDNFINQLQEYLEES